MAGYAYSDAGIETGSNAGNSWEPAGYTLPAARICYNVPR